MDLGERGPSEEELEDVYMPGEGSDEEEAAEADLDVCISEDDEIWVPHPFMMVEPRRDMQRVAVARIFREKEATILAENGKAKLTTKEYDALEAQCWDEVRQIQRESAQSRRSSSSASGGGGGGGGESRRSLRIREGNQPVSYHGVRIQY